MAQIVWDDELASLAQLNTKQCKMQHDACHNTAKFRYSGQNLGAKGSSQAHYDSAVVVNGVIDSWYSEYSFANPNDINKLTRIYNEKK